ncbi:MAG: NAD+ synthase [Verrucomicrobiota bacterium]|nr:NAD+ synthase [Verrucomicrobiota bacterium]
MKVALAQLNTTVGDLAGNTAAIQAAYDRGRAAEVEIVVTPELSVTGYPPRDLLLRPGFVENNLRALERLAQTTGTVGLLVGYVGRNTSGRGRELTNSVALLQNGRIVASRSKTLLPTYDLFDEDRYFEPADSNEPVVFNGRPVGLTICEDFWNDEFLWRTRRYRKNPALDLCEAGAQVIFNISASPWHLGKNRMRHALLSSVASKLRCPLVYCNLVGGNDELIFDGSSVVFDRNGEQIARGALFGEDFIVVDADRDSPVPTEAMPDEEKLYKALVLGLHDYVAKCGFSRVVVGLSGGIDSALTACIAAEALGPENVWGVSLPSKYSSHGSLDDARQLAMNLGIRYDVIPIQAAFDAVERQLAPIFGGRKPDVAEENIQARLRGVCLMALSNKFGALLLNTGNKSETAVGYCTLYGDMCGGLAVISDVPKTMIYRIARWLNRERELIPASTILKPPSAELRPNQTDQDTLPPYEVLDAILEAYVVEGHTGADIVASGFDEATVKRVIRMIDACEYKRRQAAPGLKVTSRAFGMGWRMPIAQRFREDR